MRNMRVAEVWRYRWPARWCCAICYARGARQYALSRDVAGEGMICAYASADEAVKIGGVDGALHVYVVRALQAKDVVIDHARHAERAP